MKLSSFLGKVWLSQKALVIGTGCVLVVGTATAGTVAVHNYRAANAVQEVVVSEEDVKEEIIGVQQSENVENEVGQPEAKENVVSDTVDELANGVTTTVTATKTRRNQNQRVAVVADSSLISQQSTSQQPTPLQPTWQQPPTDGNTNPANEENRPTENQPGNEDRPTDNQSGNENQPGTETSSGNENQPETETPSGNENQPETPSEDENGPETETPSEGEDEPETENPAEDETEEPSKDEEQDAYKLVWADEFEGTELNMNDWNYEYHEPGWVNAEWQEYVDAEENIYLEDGNLIIQPIKTVDEDGNAYYTSGRINTLNKQEFQYGRFEMRGKVSDGKGLLPAFWMMPADENFYGQWPKCGEIDVMEVLGDDITKAHGTLHFGEPHTQRQGTYKLTEGDFSGEYHVFACEWEPGEIRFYVDDELYFTENDWFTKRNGFGEVAYPAPYDQPFYLILNVAVGGSWVGYPDETTMFDENARMVVDYVRVYQKESYDENVEKPIKDVVLRDPDETGNYVINGDFAVNESVADDKDWSFKTALGGVGQASVSDGELHITTTNAGTADYSIQMVQPEIPLEKGYQYKVSFDAYADETRTIITGVTAPDLNYIRYMADTTVDLSTSKQSYSYTFDMTSDSDPNGRMEFNLGNQGSTATVHIDNVRIEKVKAIEIAEEKKGVLPDGNYVYNGSFDEGSNRMAYWEVSNNCAGATVCVANENLVRQLKVEVPAIVTALDQVIVKQSPVVLTGEKTYKLTFRAYATEEKSVQVRVAGNLFDIPLTTEKKEFSYIINTDAGLDGTDLEFLLGAAGVTFIDDVRIQEDGMIVNGDFVNGMVGWEAYVNETAKVSYGVDELTETNIAMGFTISDTGDQDWKIQLKQNNIKLEEGKCYRIKFDARSTMDRTIMYALQRDGSSDDNWIPYSGTQKIDLTGNYQTYEYVFKMTNATDEKTILSISMGAVNGTQITDKHTVYIDNVSLEEVPESELPETPEVPAGDNMIANGDFANAEANWENAITAPGAAEVSFSDGKAVYNISNVGAADWNVQLKQGGLTLEQGADYELSFTVKSSEARTIKAAFLTATYGWYGGADIVLEKDVAKIVNVPIHVDQATDTNITFVISMGVIDGVETPVSVIEIDDISLIKK